MERELAGSVELEAQKAGLGFTRRVRCQISALSWLTRCLGHIITPHNHMELWIIWDMRGKNMAKGALIVVERAKRNALFYQRPEVVAPEMSDARTTTGLPTQR